MSTKIMKILTVILTVALMVTMGVSVVYAADEFNPGSMNANFAGTNGIQNLGNKVMGIIQVIGTIVSVVILIVLGIKYMMGSAEEKAEYKKTMIPYLVGAVLVFAGTSLVKVIYSLAVAVK